MTYWIDTGYACGGVIVKDEIIIGGAPIFNRFFGQSIHNLLGWKQTKDWRRLKL